MGDQDASAAVTAAEAALLLLPPLAFVASKVLRSRRGTALRAACLASAGLIAAVWVTAWAGVGLTSRLANFLVYLAAYGPFCFLVASAPLLRPRALGWVLATAGSIVVALGYAAATVGFLALAWITLDFAGPPWASEVVAPGMVCETTGWGSAASASGYRQHIYEAWPLGLRRELDVFSIMQTEPADPDLSCAEAYRRYRATSGR